MDKEEQTRWTLIGEQKVSGYYTSLLDPPQLRTKDCKRKPTHESGELIDVEKHLGVEKG